MVVKATHTVGFLIVSCYWRVGRLGTVIIHMVVELVQNTNTLI